MAVDYVIVAEVKSSIYWSDGGGDGGGDGPRRDAANFLLWSRPPLRSLALMSHFLISPSTSFSEATGARTFFPCAPKSI